MKKAKKVIYILRIIGFIIQFYLAFMIIDAMIHTGFFGYLFIAIFLFYNITMIVQLLNIKEEKEEDVIYNIMQLGYFLYIFVFFFRIRISHVFVGSETIGYFNLNFGILSLLLVFIILYNFIELKNIK